MGNDGEQVHIFGLTVSGVNLAETRDSLYPNDTREMRHNGSEMCFSSCESIFMYSVKMFRYLRGRGQVDYQARKAFAS